MKHKCKSQATSISRTSTAMQKKVAISCSNDLCTVTGWLCSVLWQPLWKPVTASLDRPRHYSNCNTLPAALRCYSTFMHHSWHGLDINCVPARCDNGSHCKNPWFLACDYWAYLASKVHNNHCRNITKLEQNIREETAVTEVGVTWQVIQHLLSTV